jgi:CheY-like chemotaxis protein
METFNSTVVGKEVLVLVIEDEKVSRRALAMLLAGSGYKAEAFGSAEEALEVVAAGHVPGVAVVDLDLPGMSGAEFLKYLERLAPVVHRVLVSAADEDRLQRVAAERNIRCLRKPIDFKELLAAMSENSGPN